MIKKVAIIDYGIGNLFSVKRSVEASGDVEVLVTNKSSEIISSDRIILPGVGAFEVGMNGLKKFKLHETILKSAELGIPIMGICLGMQMLASISREFGDTNGLDLIPGEVKEIPKVGVKGNILKVPFIGWAPLEVENGVKNNILQNVKGESVYFVHSYQFIPRKNEHLAASYYYSGNLITAAVRNKNILGVQFHPEKSGRVGLRIIKDFIENELK